MTIEEETEDQIPCPECGALNLPDARFCADCGCVLVAAARKGASTPPPLPRPRRGQRKVTTDAVEKARARQEFARTKNIVLTIRFVYWSCAIFAVLQVALWHTVLARLATRELGSWYLPVTALVYGQLALMVAGGLLVLRAPLLWATVGACYWTLNSVFGWLVVLNMEIGLTTVFVGFQTLLLVAFWFAVAQAARVQRLMAENPELQIVRKRIDPGRRVEGGVADHARTRRRKERGQAWQGRLKIAGIAGGMLVLVIVAGWVATRPPSVDATLETFAKAWGRSDLDGIAELFAGDSSSVRAMRERCERHGWLAGLPSLGEPEIKDHGTSVAAAYDTPNGPITATFHLLEDSWQLAGLNLPPLDPTDLKPALDAFRRAWAATGTDALTAMFRPANRDRLGRNLASILKRRGWDQNRPELGGDDPGRLRDGRCSVLFGIGHDDMQVTFDYWHPEWYVVSLRPPSR